LIFAADGERIAIVSPKAEFGRARKADIRQVDIE
jgi:hypothetical protein